MEISLGLDTSSPRVSAALVTDAGKVLAVKQGRECMSHSEEIAEIVRVLLERAGVGISDIRRCVLASGPGSFTGLRIGFGFVSGLALGGGLEVAVIGSLQGYAFEFLERSRLIFSVSDARRGEVFCQPFVVRSGKIDSVCEPEILKISELEGKRKELEESHSQPSSLLVGYSPEGSTLEVLKPLRVGESLARLGLQLPPEGWKTGVKVSELEPLYLRAVAAKTLLERAGTAS